MDTSSTRILPNPHPRHRPTRAEIIYSQSEINKIDIEISKLHARIDEPQAQIDRLQHERANYVSYISPFRCLPAEILTNILHHCLEDDNCRRIMMKICGTIRDIVIGMPTFWVKIRIWYPRYYHDVSDRIHCATVEYLELILIRAGSIPLDISIDWTSRKQTKDMVGLISSRKCLIQSLAIQSLPNERDLIDPTMWGLNMSILKNLSLKDRVNGLAKEFLDLAVQSNQDQMTIELYQTQSTLLKHELLKYAIELSITGNFNDLSQRKVSLPRVRSLHLKGDQRTLDAFDLVNLESLHFWWMDYSPQQFSPHCLPTQLINLSLSRTELTSKQMSQKKAHYLPNLLTLRLSSMGIEGPLQHYFELPRLKHMEISEVKFRRLLKPNAGEEYDDEDEEHREYNAEIYEEIDPVSWADMLFSSKVPTLETLILFSIPIFNGLVLELQTYPNLKRLSVGGIDVTSFFSSLIGCLADNVRYFPVLCRVDIKASWTSGTAMSYARFVDYCASRRPHMEIYGAGLYEC